MTQLFHEIGSETGKIDVRVSYRIIQLFSDGLYSSPNKALEELVSNAWDAGAENAHVILPADRDRTDAEIVVVDDGTGMDDSGLRQHWLLGDSKKRLPESKLARGRKPIGKFGIGKLATYVLANRLTHITKTNGKYYSTSMDYRLIDEGAGEATSDQVVRLSLRQLDELQAREAVSKWIGGESEAAAQLQLFGRAATDSWTVAIMSDLKEMARQLSHKRLKWVLETAMPLGDDFKLYLNGERIQSSKESANKVGVWYLGRDVGTLLAPFPRPAPAEFEVSEVEPNSGAGTDAQVGVFHPKLQRVTGFLEAYENELSGKSEHWGESNGFFVYVRGRRINIDDPGFGIDRNKLQHGTFSRFRMVVHLDGLDEELRSSRETIRAGEKLELAKQLLISCFNFVRSKLVEHAAKSPGAALAERVADSPASLTSRPVFNLLTSLLEERATPRFMEAPKNLSEAQRAKLLTEFGNPDEEGFRLVDRVELAVLAAQDPIARYAVDSRLLRINAIHPFVAHFLNEFQDSARSLPLELISVSEVLFEAHMYQTFQNERQIQEVLGRRDQLLRHLAKTTGKKNAFLIAQDLEDAALDRNALERELVNAFLSLGYEAVPQGGAGKPDGIADAHLSATRDGERRYRVSLESKSKESTGAKVSAKAVNISAIARQRDDFNCHHALIVGPDFPSSNEGKTALEKEIASALGKGDKTITLMKVADLARLVRLQPRKRIGLVKLRELFTTCRMPEDSCGWVDRLETLVVEKPPYREILETLWGLQRDEPESQVQYGKLKTALRLQKNIGLNEDTIKELCQAMMGIAGGNYIQAGPDTVELSQKPDRVLEEIRSVDEQQLGYPGKK